MRGKTASGVTKAFEGARAKQAQYERVAALDSTLSIQTTRQYHLRRLLLDARDHRRSLQATVECDKQRSTYSSYEGQLQEKVSEVQYLETQLTEIERKIAQTREELQAAREAMEQELQISAQDIKASQQELKATRGEIDRLESLVADRRVTLAELEIALNGDEQKLETLQRKREDHLAEVALGNRELSDVDGLDKAIDEALEAPETQDQRLNNYRDAMHTLAGLERQMEARKAQYEGLQRDMPHIMEHYLRGVAAKIYDDYRKYAEGLVTCFSRLTGLNQLIAQATGAKSEILAADVVQIPHPTTRMPGARDSDQTADIFGLFSAPNVAASAIESERTRLTNQGINPP